MSKLTKNPLITKPLIDLTKKSDGFDEEMNEPLVIRHRIMSERLQE